MEYENSVKKIEYFGNNQILLTDRGTFFGYNMLINDMKSFPIMSETGYLFVMMQLILYKCQLLWETFQEVKGDIPMLVRAAVACGKCFVYGGSQ